MGIYFNYRTPFNSLNSKYTTRLDSGSIINWLQKIWKCNLDEDELYNHYLNEFGNHFYGLSQLAYNLSRKNIAPPSNLRQFAEILFQHSYITDIAIEGDSFIQVLTDDDEFELSWFLIEENYAKSNLKRFSYMIRESNYLPLQYSDSSSIIKDIEFEEIIASKTDEGELYYLSVFNDSGEGPISDIPTRFKGLRLPRLLKYLRSQSSDLKHLDDLMAFYSLLVKNSESKSFEEALTINSKNITKFHQLYHFYIDFDHKKLKSNVNNSKKEIDYAFSQLENRRVQLIENGKGDINDINDLIIHNNQHLMQIFIQSDFWKKHPVDSEIKNAKVYDQILIFDDLWVDSNYELAHSIFNYYTKRKL